MLQPIPDEASCHRCNGDSRHEGLPHDVVPHWDVLFFPGQVSCQLSHIIA